MNMSDMIGVLSAKGLKVTPQRLAVLGALVALPNHPTADSIKAYVNEQFPSLALGTVYNILDVFFEKGIVTKVKTDRDFVRYDIEVNGHHHLYCDECDYIENYFDEELDNLLQSYFQRKGIPNFNIRDINLQIVGSYINHNPPKNL
ncbi:MAG: transcriptional repressor [Bacteroidales bacterium]|nr:transcriptional repressor [Bacteroidales bacterium]MBN2747943.1 transcriptional repressor [Bacteroidales bacterium]